jgi:hypothetical protein
VILPKRDEVQTMTNNLSSLKINKQDVEDKVLVTNNNYANYNYFGLYYDTLPILFQNLNQKDYEKQCYISISEENKIIKCNELFIVRKKNNKKRKILEIWKEKSGLI